jgi:hypothetical protein
MLSGRSVTNVAVRLRPPLLLIEQNGQQHFKILQLLRVNIVGQLRDLVRVSQT